MSPFHFTRSLAHAVLLCGSVAVHAACRSDAGGADAGPAAADAGVHADAAAPEDAGFAPDAREVEVPDAGPADAGARPEDAGPPDAGGPSPQARCFPEVFQDPSRPGPQYEQFGPTFGSHCLGTNQQDIRGIERVVFLGDSITVGTPPSRSEETYRARLADTLAARFNLQAPSDAWKRYNPITGQALVQESGDFASCAKWGGSLDDLLSDGRQLEDCFPSDQRGKRTLVIMTNGGNDVAYITRHGAPSGDLSLMRAEEKVHQFIQRLEDGVRWLKDPARFPAGVSIVYSNLIEFTDATGDVQSCAAARTAGFAEPWPNPADLERLIFWMNEQYVRIAVEAGADVIFGMESFCGHGYRNDDAAGRCYRGPMAERWFDLSCIHPNPTGHQVLHDLFMAVIDE